MSDREHEFSFSRKNFDYLRQKVTEFSGIQADTNKYEMFYARLAKRLRTIGLSTFEEYVALIDSDSNEFIQFINAITTNVTAFGREQHHFDYLKEHFLKKPGESVSIWSAGCSSGEEPYSVALNLYPQMERLRGSLSILATDLDSEILSRAATGIYNVDAIKNFDLRTKRAFFRKGRGNQDGKCMVKPCLKSLIQFQQLNLIKPWDLKRQFDVIFCRNVMIYFSNEDKQRLIDKYAEHLKPEGILFLGHSESLHKSTDRFANIGRTIFRKKY